MATIAGGDRSTGKGSGWIAWAPLALGLLGVVAFHRGTARILVDAFYFSHEDWPQGREFVVGHFLLTTLFCFLAVSYLGLVGWRVWGG